MASVILIFRARSSHAERLSISIHRLFLVRLLPARREVAAHLHHRHFRIVLPVSVEEHFPMVCALARNGVEAVRGLATRHIHVPARGIGHVLFNMLALWMFGMDLERDWGTRRFLKY